jgi:hypothetical protein
MPKQGQVMKQIYDIRDQMPKFNANFFPQPDPDVKYPKMMVNPETRKPYLDAAKNPVLVHSDHEEQLFLARNYKEAPVVEAKAVEIPIVAVAPQRAQFEALTPAQAEKAAAANETVAPKRRGRPPMPKDLK